MWVEVHKNVKIGIGGKAHRFIAGTHDVPAEIGRELVKAKVAKATQKPTDPKAVEVDEDQTDK